MLTGQSGLTMFWDDGTCSSYADLPDRVAVQSARIAVIIGAISATITLSDGTRVGCFSDGRRFSVVR